MDWSRPWDESTGSCAGPPSARPTRTCALVVRGVLEESEGEPTGWSLVEQ